MPILLQSCSVTAHESLRLRSPSAELRLHVTWTRDFWVVRSFSNGMDVKKAVSLIVGHSIRVRTLVVPY